MRTAAVLCAAVYCTAVHCTGEANSVCFIHSRQAEQYASQRRLAMQCAKFTKSMITNFVCCCCSLHSSTYCADVAVLTVLGCGLQQSAEYTVITA